MINVTGKRKKSRPKTNILYDSIYMEHPKQVNLQSQKGDYSKSSFNIVDRLIELWQNDV